MGDAEDANSYNSGSEHETGQLQMDEVSKLKAELAEQEDQAIELEAEVEVLREENSLLETQIKKEKIKNSQLQETLDEQANELKLCSSSARLAAQQLLQKQRASAPKTTHDSELYQKCEALKDELRCALDTISHLKASNGEAHVRNGALKRSVASLTTQQKKHEAIVSELEAARSSLETQLNECRRQNNKHNSPKPKPTRPRALFRKYASAKPATNGTFAALAESLRFMGFTEFGQFAREVAGVVAPHFNNAALKEIFNEAANIRTAHSDGHRGLINEEQFLYSLRMMLDHAKEHEAAGAEVLTELCEATGVLSWRHKLIESVFEMCTHNKPTISIDSLRQMQASVCRRTPLIGGPGQFEHDVLRDLVAEAALDGEVGLCGFKKVVTDLNPPDEQLVAALVQLMDLHHEVVVARSVESTPMTTPMTTPREKSVESLEAELKRTKQKLREQTRLRTAEQDRRQHVGAGATLAQAELQEMLRRNAALEAQVHSYKKRWGKDKWRCLTESARRNKQTNQDKETMCQTTLSLTNQVAVLREELAAVEAQYESLVDRNLQLVNEHKQMSSDWERVDLWYEQHTAMLQETFRERQPSQVLQQAVDDGVAVALLVLAQARSFWNHREAQDSSVAHLAQLISRQADGASKAQHTLQMVLERTVGELELTKQKQTQLVMGADAALAAVEDQAAAFRHSGDQAKQVARELMEANIRADEQHASDQKSLRDLRYKIEQLTGTLLDYEQRSIASQAKQSEMEAACVNASRDFDRLKHEISHIAAQNAQEQQLVSKFLHDQSRK